MPNCALCTWCTEHTLPHNEHVILKHPQCQIIDEKHEPGVIPCKCKRDPITHEWIHNPECPKHPV